MIAKQYLQRGRDIQRQITQLYEKRSEFFDRATSTTMAISPVKVQTSHSGQGLENAIIGMVDTEEKINNKIAELQMQNTVNSGDDIDGFMTKLTDSVNEAVDNMTEGVHE